MNHAILLLCLAVLAGAVGCGRPATTAEVRGRVSLGDDPLPGGLIRFYVGGKGGRWSGATIEADGSYAVPDVPLGRCVVTIDTSNLKNLAALRPAATPPGAPSAPGTPDPSLPQVAYKPIAKKYASVETSPLAAEVKPGKNVVELQLD